MILLKTEVVVVRQEFAGENKVLVTVLGGNDEAPIKASFNATQNEAQEMPVGHRLEMRIKHTDQ